MEETLSAWLRASGEREFLLVIGGRISGVHDGKGRHMPLDYQIDDSTVIIHFEGSEHLILSNPTEITMQPSGELAVKDASEVRFAWYTQDNPKDAPRLCEEVFTKYGTGVEFSRTGASFITSGGFAYGGDQFIILRYSVRPHVTCNYTKKFAWKEKWSMKNIKTLKIIALVFPGLTVAVLLLFALGETIGGDWSGLGHLFQAIPIVLLMWLGWKRPFWSGILLLVLSFLALYSFVDVRRGPDWLAPFLIIVVPLFLSGVLLLTAARLERGGHLLRME